MEMEPWRCMCDVSNGDGARAAEQAATAVAHVTRSARWREICQMRARHRMRGVISPLCLPPLPAHDAGQDNLCIRRLYDRQGHRAPPASAGPARQPREGPVDRLCFLLSFAGVDTGRDRRPLHLSNHRGAGRANDLCFPFPHVPLTSSPSSTPHRSSSSSELPVIPQMDGLPGELCFKIFHLLDHQSLAAAPRVCRKWNALTCDDELWRKLFEDRWGADATAFYAPEPEGAKPWKDVFVVQDRCDRYGLGVRIIREGNDYYLIYQGEIQSYLGTSSDAKDAPPQSAEAGKRQISDRILFFLGDLETAYADAKRVKL